MRIIVSDACESSLEDSAASFTHLSVAYKSFLTLRPSLLVHGNCLGCAGNPLKPGFLSEPCYNLVYLEIAACRLITLPADFARMVPNVRILNLNYNHLEDPRPLEGLTRLRKLTILHSRIKHAKQLIRMLRGMKDIEVIDFRCVEPWPVLSRFKAQHSVHA